MEVEALLARLGLLALQAVEVLADSKPVESRLGL
jgi:hypothetical protein